jgi:hypothetical protein
MKTRVGAICSYVTSVSRRLSAALVLAMAYSLAAAEPPDLKTFATNESYGSPQESVGNFPMKSH